MGCDIHSLVEKREEGVWYKQSGFKSSCNYMYSNSYSDETDELIDARDYFLFGLLAGVRSGIKPIKPCEYKLPDDVCEEIKSSSDEWGDDFHSHSWYTAKELLDWIKIEENFNILRTVYPNEIGWSWLFTDCLGQLMERSDSDGSDVRVVFWFDN